MEPERIYQVITVSYRFPVIFTRQAFSPDNPLFDALLAPPHDTPASRIVVCVDQGVACAWPGLLSQIPDRLTGLAGIELAGDILVLPGGEQAKNGMAVVERVLAEAARARLDRQSLILAIGGGAMLDAVGMAASLIHRGVRLVRMPSTVLGQNDAGIGVKNGVNAFGQKNFLGCFSPPEAVVNDLELLQTLADRHWRAGIAEAIKVACIKDAAFFARIEAWSGRLAGRDDQAMESLVRECARLHLEHTSGSGDPFETGSARPLDFGHWSAHWLEMATGGEVLHGEAVAIGIALDVLYAGRAGLISGSEVERVLSCLASCGFALWHQALAAADEQGRPAVFAGLEQFREHLGGRLNLTLPCPLGAKREIHEVDLRSMRLCLQELQTRSRS